MIDSKIKEWKLLLEKANSGDTNAMNDVFLYYRDGYHINNYVLVEQDKDLALMWIKKSFLSKNPTGMLFYADFLSDSENPTCDKEKAMSIYKEAIDLGCFEAYHNLGIEYRNKGDFKKAFECYAIVKGEFVEFEDLSIGLCYYYGIGVEKNKLKALEIFKKQKAQDCTPIEFNEINYLMGIIYLEGEIVPKSLTKARYYLEMANEDYDHTSAEQLLSIIGRDEDLWH